MTTKTNTALRMPHEGAQVRRKITPPPPTGQPPFAAYMPQEKPAAAPQSIVPFAPVSPGGQGKTQASALDATRTHTLHKADVDMRRTQALHQLNQTMGGGDTPLDAARNATTMRNLRSVVGGFSLRAPAMPMAGSIKSQALQQNARTGHIGQAGQAGQTGQAGQARHTGGIPQSQQAGIGKLAAQFESGGEGIAAIGYDRHGGTSYGKYQIASRVGTMDRFLNFLDTAAPDISKTLRSAGPANTGGRQGAMPTAWRTIASQQPERFEALQEKFIYDSHYKPALDAVTQNTPLDEGNISSAMQEVLWSTAVQHGPNGAARIFSQASARAGNAKDKNYDKRLINNVYAIRAEQFGSSTEEVQSSVRNRMHREKALALNMLDPKKSPA